jgi:chromosome segregation ATPase
MTCRISNPWIPAAAAALLLVAASAVAQTQRSGSPASAQLAAQLQQLASERTALQAENAKVKAELADVKKQLDALKQSRDGARQQQELASRQALARTSADVERLQAEQTRDRERTQELVNRFRETANNLKDVETDRTAARRDLSQRDSELKSCVEKNGALITLNEEVLSKLEDQGFWSNFASNEPFTRIKRNQLENLADSYRLRAADQKIAAP